MTFYNIRMIGPTLWRTPGDRYPGEQCQAELVEALSKPY